MIDACAPEEQRAFVVLEDIAHDKVPKLHLAHGSREIQGTVELQILRNVAKELIHAVKTDGLEHFFTLSDGIRDIAFHLFVSLMIDKRNTPRSDAPRSCNSIILPLRGELRIPLR